MSKTENRGTNFLDRSFRLAAKLLKKVLGEGFYRKTDALGHHIEALIAAAINGWPARDLKIIGITGTNGKTTTAHFVSSILEAAGYKVGMSTTARFKIGDKLWDNELNSTLANPFRIQELLKQMKSAHVDWVVMEVTSHALAQHRIAGVPIHTGVITNLTQDHLDYHYHTTMEEYAHAKAKLFKIASENAVLNHDDEWFGYFAQHAPQHRFTYGVNPETDIRLLKANLKPEGSKIQISYGLNQPPTLLELNLPGKFNVYNALAAATVGLALELPLGAIKKGLHDTVLVPGRMEAVNTNQKFKVLVDYAHTPDAFTNLFETLRPLTKRQLIVVFGATGNRDKGKRPLMGAIAARNCDVVIVTDDDPFTEDPAPIRKAVLAGARQAKPSARVLEVANRKKAISKAFELARPGDTVAILGLGHQHFRVVGDKKEVWDDRQVAKELLNNKSKKSKPKTAPKKT